MQAKRRQVVLERATFGRHRRPSSDNLTHRHTDQKVYTFVERDGNDDKIASQCNSGFGTCAEELLLNPLQAFRLFRHTHTPLLALEI